MNVVEPPHVYSPDGIPPDILKSGIKLPVDLVILGTGPLGKAHWSDIEGKFIVAVNGAIHIPVRSDIWLVGDKNALKTEWFKRGLETCACMRIFSHQIWRRMEDRAKIDYGYYTLLKKDNKYNRLPDRFRLTESIIGVALDLVTRFGTKRIILCGVDQAGRYYYDGTKANDYKKDTCHATCRRLAKAIEMVKRDGVQIFSISPTRLPGCGRDSGIGFL